jgi:hypothetical protein
MVRSTDDESLEQFYQWLRDDVDVVRSTTITAIASEVPGNMGAFEVIAMALSGATALANVAISWASFRRSQPAPPPITMNIVGTFSDEQLEMLKKLDLPLAPSPTESDD